MLVVVILLITTLLAAPAMVRSFRFARLRTSARTVVMAHRHARSMSVLQQKQMALLFDTEQQQVELVSVGTGTRESRDMFLEGRADRLESETPQDGEDEDLSGMVQSEMIRGLAENVKIVEFGAENGAREIDGIYWISYFPNGMTQSYELVLEDENQRAMRIEVDAMSGKIRVEKER